MRFWFIAVALFLNCTPNFVLEKKQYGLNEFFIPQKGWEIVKIDTVWGELGGVVKTVQFRVQQKKSHRKSIYD